MAVFIKSVDNTRIVPIAITEQNIGAFGILKLIPECIYPLQVHD